MLQINVTANWGSTGKIAEMIANIATKAGWDCYMAWGRKVNRSEQSTIRVGNKIDVLLHMFESVVLDRNGLSSRHSTRKLVHEIERIKPDIIHLHNIHGYYINYPILMDYLSTLNIPIVWTLHDCWPFVGSCYFYDSYKCSEWKVGCSNDCPARKKWYCLSNRTKENLACKIENFTKLKNLTLVPVSNWLADSVRESPLGHYPIYTVHNGINTALFAPTSSDEKVCKKYGLDENKQIVLGVANIWSSRKGLEDMILLADMLPAQFQIVLIGLSKEQQQKLPDNVRGLRRTDSVKELQSIYSRALVYVNLTKSDNFPTTNIEALACGTPVITYKTGGSPEAVSEETGFVLEQGDVKGVRKCILAVSERGKNNYSEACRERAVGMFNQNIQYSKYVDLYKQLLNRDIES